MSSGLKPKEALHKLGACLRGRGFERVCTFEQLGRSSYYIIKQ